MACNNAVESIDCHCPLFIRFLKLPPWMKLIMTSRNEPLEKIPQFILWHPREIRPLSEDNKADLKELITVKLNDCSFMSPDLRAFAAKVMVERSKVSHLSRLNVGS